MVARHEDDAGAAIDLAQNFVHHLLLRLAPVPAPLELPAIDDVADQEQRLAFIVGQEIGQGLGLATRCAQMRVRDEDGAVAALAGPVDPGNGGAGRFRPRYGGV